MTNDYHIIHFVEGDKHDFNLRSLPDEIILPLRNALGWEEQVRRSARCAPEFRKERLVQQQRYLDQCQKSGDTPRQIFIDFPVS